MFAPVCDISGLALVIFSVVVVVAVIVYAITITIAEVIGVVPVLVRLSQLLVIS